MEPDKKYTKAESENMNGSEDSAVRLPASYIFRLSAQNSYRAASNGSSIKNVVPSPVELSTDMPPPC